MNHINTFAKISASLLVGLSYTVSSAHAAVWQPHQSTSSYQRIAIAINVDESLRKIFLLLRNQRQERRAIHYGRRGKIRDTA